MEPGHDDPRNPNHRPDNHPDSSHDLSDYLSLHAGDLEDDFGAELDEYNAMFSGEGTAIEFPHDAELRSAQSAREQLIASELAGVIDPRFGVELGLMYNSLADVESPSNVIANRLRARMQATDISEEEYRSVLYLEDLNTLVFEASMLQRTPEDTYEPALAKSEVQLTVLASEAFDRTVQEDLVEFIDHVMPGESIDINDPDSVQRALNAYRANPSQ